MQTRSILSLLVVVLVTAMAAGQTTSETGDTSRRKNDRLSYRVLDEVRIEADGVDDNTYDLFTKHLGKGALEVPDRFKNNHPGHRHIQQRKGSPYGPYFEFTIHRDTDRDRGMFPKNADRQRNEIKAYDKSVEAAQGKQGETVRYHWYFRLADDLPVTRGFSHFMQLKAYDRDGGGLPILTISGYDRPHQPRGRVDRLEIRHTESNRAASTTLGTCPWKDARGQWLEAEVVATYSDRGYLQATIRNEAGDALISVERNGIDLWRDGAEFIRPKWGIYRSLKHRKQLVNEVDHVDFADFTIQKIRLHPDAKVHSLQLTLPPEASDASPTGKYEDLLEHRSGFARHVTGGAGGEVVVLDTLNFATLRKALADDKPRWIRFKPGLKGGIELTGHLEIGSNKTIDGRGAEITMTSPGDCDEMRFWGRIKGGKVVGKRRNLIVHNIKIINVGKGDNCGQGLGVAFGAKDVWVDHVTFSGNGDESLSMGKGATNLTVSWCRFVDTDKAILLSWGSSGEDARLDPAMRVTIHHNYFLRVNGRSPALRFGKVHYFNNFLKDWNWSGVDATMGGQIYSENNIYGGGRWDNSPPALLAEPNRWSPKTGFIKSLGDRFVNVDGIDGRGPGINKGDVFDPRNQYEYKAERPNDGLKERLEKHAGWSTAPHWPKETVR